MSRCTCSASHGSSPRTSPSPIISSVLAAVSCTVDQCSRWSARLAAASAVARSWAKPAAITSSAIRPPRWTSCHSSRDSPASTIVQTPPSRNAWPIPIPGVSAAPTTSAAPTAPAAANPVRGRVCHCRATTANDSNGVTHPAIDPVSPGATSSGWASPTAHSTATSTTHSQVRGARRIRTL
jgi:hypothetical protein